MPRLLHKVSKKAGLAPGTLIHIGEKKTDRVKIKIFDYDESQAQETEVSTVEEAFLFTEKATTTWIDVAGIHDVGVIEKIGNHFGLHSLTLEDILHAAQRPKMDDYDGYVFVVLKMLYYDEEEREVKAEQLSLILGPNWVISFQEMEKDVFDPVRERIRKGKGRIRKSGADYLTYVLVDAVVDSYFSILEKVGEEIEEIEQELIDNPKTETLQAIHELKREMILLRKSVWPLREVVSTLERGESSLIQDSTQLFLRDVYDHTIQVIDTIETFRDMLSGMLDLYLSSISNKMNEVMKVLTIMATIFIPVTFVAGIYGMNFEYMPELKWPFGYFLVWLVILAIGMSMIIYFKRKKWL